MRQAKCLRRSNKFLIPVGPFMDKWGRDLGASNNLTLDEKGEIVAAFVDGHKRQDSALGYVRAYHGMLETLPNGIEGLERCLPYDLIYDLKNSKFGELAKVSEEEMVNDYKCRLQNFICPVTGHKFQ